MNQWTMTRNINLCLSRLKFGRVFMVFGSMKYSKIIEKSNGYVSNIELVFESLFAQHFWEPRKSKAKMELLTTNLNARDSPFITLKYTDKFRKVG